MTIRRIDKGPNVTASKSRRVREGGGEDFSWHLSSLAGLQAADGVDGVDAVPSATDEPGRRQRREQLEQTRDLLDSLEALGHDFEGADARHRLRESRDQALRTLSESPRPGAERELLQRTALLATVELAKSERGDYT